jgi:hypothetical protein
VAGQTLRDLGVDPADLPDGLFDYDLEGFRGQP